MRILPAPGHRIYPYLLRDVVIDRPNQVWAADITYIPIGRGSCYLVAIIDVTAHGVGIFQHFSLARAVRI